jgi:hypothetical protein
MLGTAAGGAAGLGCTGLTLTGCRKRKEDHHQVSGSLCAVLQAKVLVIAHVAMLARADHVRE